MSQKLGRWLVILCTGKTAKTYRWLVSSAKWGSSLGEIRWYGPWRCYALFPEKDVLFNAECLKDIASFLENAPKVEAQ